MSLHSKLQNRRGCGSATRRTNLNMSHGCTVAYIKSIACVYQSVACVAAAGHLSGHPLKGGLGNVNGNSADGPRMSPRSS